MKQLFDESGAIRRLRRRWAAQMREARKQQRRLRRVRKSEEQHWRLRNTLYLLGGGEPV